MYVRTLITNDDTTNKQHDDDNDRKSQPGRLDILQHPLPLLRYLQELASEGSVHSSQCC